MGNSQINARGAQQAAIAGESHTIPKPAEQKKDRDMSHLSYDFGNMPLHATGQSGIGMDNPTQSSMSQHFGADFAGVKIHTDDHAASMNRQLNARAFTLNNNIYFNAGEYKPGTKAGQHLLAHELVHTIQQRAAPSSAAQAKSIIDRPDSLHEKEADNIANSFTQAQDPVYHSSALQMRSNMRITPLANAAMQRMPKTTGGEWFADTYTEYNSGTGRGIDDIHLRFKPNATVDAELIGLTQSYRSIHNKSAFYLNNDPFYKGRAIKAADAKTAVPATGETDEGNMIDRVKEYNNPIYPVQSLPSNSLDDTNTSAGWGQLGWRYTDHGTLKEKDATLIDAPKIKSVDVSKNSGQIFETTALATKGNQAGTYYGSVRWGWRTDNAGNFGKLPLEVVSEGVPSSTFMKSAELWNASKSSTGADTVDLPIIDVKVTTGPIKEVLPASSTSIPMSSAGRTIDPGTRVQMVFFGSSSAAGESLPRIKILSGVFIGSTITISVSDLSKLKAERS
jgi:hypothetical protein